MPEMKTSRSAFSPGYSTNARKSLLANNDMENSADLKSEQQVSLEH